MRIAGTPVTLLEIVLVETGLGHLVSAQLLARNPRRAGRADATAQAVLGTVIVGPALHPVRILGDVGHQVPKFARRVRREQLGRQPEHVEMTIGRYSPVLHNVTSTPSFDPGETFRYNLPHGNLSEAQRHILRRYAQVTDAEGSTLNGPAAPPLPLIWSAAAGRRGALGSPRQRRSARDRG